MEVNKEKILYITDNPINGIGGGSLENKKYYSVIHKYAVNNNCELRVVSLDKDIPERFGVIAVHKSRKNDIFARICGHSSYMYFVWKKYKKLLLNYEPNIVYIARTRLGFVAKDFKKYDPRTAVICNIENIEYDYVDAYFSQKKGIIKKLKVLLEKKCVKRDERDAFSYSDHVDFLTKRDKDRANKLYKYNKAGASIIPICIESETNLKELSSKRTVVFIGTLSYGSNLSAINWFVTKVWKPYYKENNKINLIIAGSNPAEELIERIDGIENCKLVENFKDKVDIIPRKSMLIAPIFSGAGMKVKVAESLSMGLMIAASNEALTGYEKISDYEGESIVRANTAEDYHKAIDKYIALSNTELESVEETNKHLFKKFYSYSIAYKEVSDTLDRMI